MATYVDELIDTGLFVELPKSQTLSAYSTTFRLLDTDFVIVVPADRLIEKELLFWRRHKVGDTLYNTYMELKHTKLTFLGPYSAPDVVQLSEIIEVVTSEIFNKIVYHIDILPT